MEQKDYKLLLPNMNPIFKDFIYKASVNEDTEIPLSIVKNEDGTLGMSVCKDFVTLRVNVFLTMKLSNFVLNEDTFLGIMSSNLFRKYLDLYTKDFSLLYKDNQVIDKLIIFSSDLKVSEILLSDLVVPSNKLIDLTKDMVIDINLTKDHIETLKGFAKVVKSNTCYIGFNKSDGDNYDIKIIIGEQKDYKFEFSIGSMTSMQLNAILNDSKFILRNHDGFDFCLKYQKKNLLSVLEVLSLNDNSDIKLKINSKGATLILETISGDGYVLDSRFGLIPIV